MKVAYLCIRFRKGRGAQAEGQAPHKRREIFEGLAIDEKERDRKA